MGSAILSKDGEDLYYFSAFEDGYDLWKMNLREKDTKRLHKLNTGWASLMLDKKGDVFLGISTSGNSQNIMSSTVVARALGIKVLGLTGALGGELSSVSDVCVKVPETETYMIQELHLPIYHCWCLMLEDHFFGESQ